MKVVSYDPSDRARSSGSLSGTFCPPQPHLQVTPILDVFRDISKRRPVYERPVYETHWTLLDPQDQDQSIINHMCVSVCVYLPGLLFWRHLPIAFLQKHQVELSVVNLYL